MPSGCEGEGDEGYEGEGLHSTVVCHEKLNAVPSLGTPLGVNWVNPNLIE